MAFSGGLLKDATRDSRNTVESAQLADAKRGDDDTETVLDSRVAVDGIGSSEFVG
jgi:hypothetical protein